MEALLEKLHQKTDDLAVRVYSLLNEIVTAKLAIRQDGSFPLEHLLRQIAEVEAAAGWITQIADQLDDVAEGIEEVLT